MNASIRAARGRSEIDNLAINVYNLANNIRGPTGEALCLKQSNRLSREIIVRAIVIQSFKMTIVVG